MDKTKADLKINYDVEFDAIYNQIDQSVIWENKALEYLKLGIDADIEKVKEAL